MSVRAAELGSLLRRYREARGLSQEELAALVDPPLNPNTVSNLERGRTRPYRHTLEGLCSALGLDTTLRAEVVAVWRGTGTDAVLAEPEPLLPPASGFRSRPNNLPVQTMHLVGREHELASIKQMLRSPSVRLVTLTGPGGIGKTRLALQAAADVLQDHVDGVFFVALAPITEPSLVASGVAQSLGVADAGTNLRDRLREFLVHKQLLLVMDNFEHLIQAAPLVIELLAEAPAIKILVTSREVLRVSGEHSFPVPPLQMPPQAKLPPLQQLTQFEAVRLFIERAQAVEPDFQVTTANAQAVAGICYQLDGLPLAIELAAARVRHLPPEALLKRLQNRMSLLTGGARDLATRQQTLRGAIAWSFDLLSPAERALCRRLAVFAGGCTLAAAEAVCCPVGEPELDIVDGIASLIDKSLLGQGPGADGEPRYRMLETLREYALEQLVISGDEANTRAKYAAYFEHLVEQAAPHFLAAEQLVWLARLDDELDNVRAVLQWLLDGGLRERGQVLVGSLWYFWSIHGPLTEGRTWLTRLLDEHDGAATPPRVRARALLALGLIATRQADLAAADQAYTESLALAERVGDDWTRAMALVYLAWAGDAAANWSMSLQREVAASTEHAPPGPAAHYETALALFRQLEDAWATAMCLGLYAQFLVPWEPARAGTLTTDALQISQRLGDRWTQASCLNKLGWLALDAGELTEARQLLERSLRLWVELNDLSNESSLLGSLAVLEMDSAAFAEALALWERCAENLKRLGSLLLRARVLHDLANTACLAGDSARAFEAYDESVALFEDLGHRDEAAWVRASAGFLHERHGAMQQAAMRFDESLRVLGREETEFGVATVLVGLARLALDTDRPADAARVYGAAEALVERLRTGPKRIYVRPANRLQWGPRGTQFRRDSMRLSELCEAYREAFGAMPALDCESAHAAGHSLNTAHAIALAFKEVETVRATVRSTDRRFSVHQRSPRA